MGNRAFIVFHNEDTNKVSSAIYLHWNGGPESIYAFLDECDRRKVAHDLDYQPARFIHVVCDYFDTHPLGAGGSSIGVMAGPSGIQPWYLAEFCKSADDNGVYVVSHKDGIRKVRRFYRGTVEGIPRCIEMTAAQVEQERVAAYAHEYHVPKEGESIAQIFRRLRPEISPYG